MVDNHRRSQSHRRRTIAEEDAGPNGLLNNLLAYWPGNEISGDALDAHAALTFSAVAAPGSNTGLVYPLARDLNGSTQYFQRLADTALQMGDTDYTIALWIRFDAVGNRYFLARYDAAPAREYLLYYDAGNSLFRWRVYDGTSSIAVATATNFGAASTLTWYLVIAWHDAANNLLGIQINDVTPDTSVTGGTAPAATNPEMTWGHGLTSYVDGRLGPLAIWRTAPGDGGVLTAAQRTALYNAGAGLPYSELTL